MSKSLTVFCPLGISNRLRVLLSGLALARAGGRQFNMLWPLTPACAAPFQTLFANDWPVTTTSAREIETLPYIQGWFGQLPDLLACETADVVVGHPGWLLRPGQFPGHDALLTECATLLRDVRPAVDIQQRIEAFRREHFHSAMIGVHLRRGDFLRERPDTAHNTTAAIAALDDFLEKMPGAGILLCTDDGAPLPGRQKPTRGEGLRNLFFRRYGKRLQTFNQHNPDRGQPQSAQDALLEFCLLRETNAFVGTLGSSFSEMVVFGQDKPHRLTAGASAGYQFFLALAVKTRLYELIARQGKQATGRDLPFPVLWRYYSRAPFRWMRDRLINRR